MIGPVTPVSHDVHDTDASLRAGPAPSRWAPPMDEASRVRATALVFLDEIGRLVAAGAPPERVSALIATARERLRNG